MTGVAFNVNSLMWMVPNALGMGASAHVGNALGRAQPRAAQRAVVAGLALGTAAMAAAALGIWLAGPLVFRAFTSDAAVVQASRPVLTPLAASVVGEHCWQFE